MYYMYTYIANVIFHRKLNRRRQMTELCDYYHLKSYLSENRICTLLNFL